MVRDGLAPSRDRAKALIMAGAVLVDDAPVTKAGSPVLPDQAVRLKAGHGGDGWASRGALKLSPALDAFGVEAQGRVCLDIGASTGGFTDVLLRRGASRVYAVDVGRGQLLFRAPRSPGLELRMRKPSDFKRRMRLMISTFRSCCTKSPSLRSGYGV